MHVEYRVEPSDDGWTVRRGPFHVADRPSQEEARTLAENLARGATAMGEHATVRILSPDGGEERRSFAPDVF